MTLLCLLCGVSSYAQTSANDKKANREKRKSERLSRKAEQQEKKLKKKEDAKQAEASEAVVQETPTLTDDMVFGVTYSDVSDNVEREVEEVSTRKEQPKITPTEVATPPSIDDSEPSKSSSSNDDGSSFLILLAIIVGVPIMILKWIFSGRCKKCGKLWAMHIIDEQYLGRSKTKIEKDNQGNRYQVHYNNIKVIEQCKYCGYTTEHVEERKG